MISDWKKTQLVDVVSILGDGLHGTPKYDEDGDYYFINGNNLSNGKIVFKNETKRVSQTEYEKYKKNLNDRTVLVSINGTLGNVALYNGEKCILGKSACYFNVKDEVDKLFIKYVVSTRDFKEYISRFANGTTIKNVSLKVMRNYSFLLPQITEQQAIGATLSSIDNKIELNNAINKNLEEIAQALFKRWFVDFEFPNENGEPYKSSGGEFEESELGLIPKGWRVMVLGELCNVNADTLSTKDMGDSIHYLDTGSITRNVIADVQYLSISTDKIPSRARRKVRPNDIVYSTVRPNQYHYGLIKEPSLNMVASTGFAVLTSKGTTSNDLVYLYLTQDEVTERLQSIAESSTSTYPSIKPSDISSLKMALPSYDKQVSFTQVVEIFHKQIWENQKQNKNLSSIRDNLLPKLMSGEIRVSLKQGYLYSQSLDLPLAAESNAQYSTS